MPRNKKGKKKGKHKSNTSRGHSSKSSQKSSFSRFFDFSSKDRKPVTYLLWFLLLFFIFGTFFVFLEPIRAKLGFGSNDISPSKLRHYRARLKNLYEKYNPSKLDEIDSILEKWRGKEKQLFKQLHKKYVKPNKEKREKEREKNKNRKRDSDGNYIPDYNNETPEEASARRRKEKEQKRQKRKKEREGYYDDWNGDNNEDTTTLRFDVCL